MLAVLPVGSDQHAAGTASLQLEKSVVQVSETEPAAFPLFDNKEGFQEEKEDEVDNDDEDEHEFDMEQEDEEETVSSTYTLYQVARTLDDIFQVFRCASYLAFMVILLEKRISCSCLIVSRRLCLHGPPIAYRWARLVVIAIALFVALFPILVCFWYTGSIVSFIFFSTALTALCVLSL
jgi:hypothetical protein